VWSLVLVPSEDLHVLDTIDGVAEDETGRLEVIHSLLCVELVAWE
jgi:hypothetical protein